MILFVASNSLEATWQSRQKGMRTQSRSDPANGVRGVHLDAQNL